MVLVAGAVAAQEPDAVRRARAAALMAQGVELGYNLDHAAALAAFGEAIAADPTDPAPYRLAAATTWITLLFGQGVITVEDYLGDARADLHRAVPPVGPAAAFHQTIRRAIALSEDRLRRQPSDADAHYQLGAAFSCLASYIATVEGRVLGSLSPARRAYRAHERVLQLDPGRTDAGLVIGMYGYAVSDLPAPMRLLARLAGLRGNSRAVTLVEQAARHPGDAQPKALFALILLYNRQRRYADALQVIGELQRRFPRNRLLWLEAGGTALRAGRLHEARAALEEGLARLSHDPRSRAAGEEARWRYVYGAALAALRDRGADRELRAALASATRDWLRGRIHLELAGLAAAAGDRPRALDEYRQAERLCRQDGDDECAGEAETLRRNRR
jgi:tetratricopeptide (TPR) repeat protein